MKSTFRKGDYMVRITDVIKKWKDEAGLKNTDIILIGACPTVRETLKICTNKPGWMIGKAGCLYNKYKDIIFEKYPHIKQIEFIETETRYIR